MAAPNVVNVSTITAKTTAGELSTTLTTSLLANAAASGKLIKINTIIIANKDGTNAADATLSFYDGSTDFYLISTIEVPEDDQIAIVDKGTQIYLEEGHEIRGGASATGDLDYIISYEEIS